MVPLLLGTIFFVHGSKGWLFSGAAGGNIPGAFTN